MKDQVIGSSDDLILSFASAAISSAPARGVPGILIVRGGQDPGIAVVGDLDGAAIARVEELFDQLEEAARSLRHVGYERAQDDVRILAERMEQRFTRPALDEAIFLPVPRGGLIVTGMLSIAMNLRHDQLHGPADNEDRLVVYVDDCGLSGHRAHQVIQASRAKRIALAFLYAPLELCHHIESREPRVQGCVAARRLRDVGPEVHGSAYAAWVDRWTQRLGDDRYWIGRPESVVFAWKEPDRSFINAATGQREASWRLVPGVLSTPPDTSGRQQLTLQRQREAKGPLGPSSNVFFADIDGTVIIAHDQQEAAIELDAVASAFWRSLIEQGSVDGIVADLEASYDISRARLEADVTRFVDELMQRGILDVGSDQRPLQ